MTPPPAPSPHPPSRSTAATSTCWSEAGTTPTRPPRPRGRTHRSEPTGRRPGRGHRHRPGQRGPELGVVEHHHPAGQAGPDPDRRPEHRRVGPHQRRQHRLLPPSRRFPSPSRPRSTCSSMARSCGPQPGRTASRWTGQPSDLAGKTAKVQIVDNNTGGWGHIHADQFTFAKAPALSASNAPIGSTTARLLRRKSPSPTPPTANRSSSPG